MSVQNLNKYITQGAIEGFASIVAPLQAFSYVVKPGVSSIGDVVRVPFANNTSASYDFAYSTGYATDGNLISGKPITMDGLKYQKISLTDSDLALLNPEALIRVGRQAGMRLAADVVSASLASVVTLANFAGSGSYGAASLSSSVGLASIDKAANDYNWPIGERSLILNSTAWQALMNNTTVLNASNFGSTGPVQQGQLQSVIGFKPYLVTFPILNSIAVQPNAVLFANGYHAPQDAGSAYSAVDQIVDEKSNLTIGFRQYYDAAKATNMRVFDCLYGAAKGASDAVWNLK